VLLSSTGPASAKAFRTIFRDLAEEATLKAVPVLQGFGAEGRAALRELAASRIQRVADAAREATVALDAANPHRLSGREREVLRLLTEGLRTKDIAERLVLTPATVSTHIQRIMAKTGTSSRAELLTLAARESGPDVK
jgi:DNA-binding NarL/FixJ family response regulator